MMMPTSCDATNWTRISPVPGGLSTREPTSTPMTSWMKVRNRFTSEPARTERSVAMKLAPTSESQSANSIDGRRWPSSSMGTSRNGPMTSIGSIGM